MYETKPHSIVLLLTTVLSLAGVASSQELDGDDSSREQPLVEFAVEYPYLFDIPSVQTVQGGFVGSAGWNVTNWLALVGEFSSGQKRLQDAHVKMHGTLGGVRLRRGGFFGQVLVGQLTVQIDERSREGRLEATLTEPVIQPGVGWDIRVTKHVAGRIQLDYRQLLSDEDDFGRQVRFAAGVTVGFGGGS